MTYVHIINERNEENNIWPDTYEKDLKLTFAKLKRAVYAYTFNGEIGNIYKVERLADTRVGAVPVLREVTGARKEVLGIILQKESEQNLDDIVEIIASKA